MADKIALLVAGPKGYQFLLNFARANRVDLVCSYETKGLRVDALGDIRRFCSDVSLPFLERKELSPASFDEFGLIMIAGWQYLLGDIDRRHIVFHDSLLPKLRGFNPTVSALILEEPRIGVTAFRPTGGVDEGPILAQWSRDITYPIRIAEAYAALGVGYSTVASELIVRHGQGNLIGLPQDESAATYSVWRDAEDYSIDWTWSAARIRRFVDAVSTPYQGARTTYSGEAIRIDRVSLLPDLDFPIRQPGKIWALNYETGAADVICGEGLLRIEAAETLDGRRVHFQLLRRRFGG